MMGIQGVLCCCFFQHYLYFHQCRGWDVVSNTVGYWFDLMCQWAEDSNQWAGITSTTSPPGACKWTSRRERKKTTCHRSPFSLCSSIYAASTERTPFISPKSMTFLALACLLHDWADRDKEDDVITLSEPRKVSFWNHHSHCKKMSWKKLNM